MKKLTADALHNSAPDAAIINANLATLRCCLLAIKASRLSHLSWQQVIETAQSNPAFAYQLISNYRLK